MVRIVSVALLLMGMLVGSVSAECAWVLWAERTKALGTSASHELVNAYAARKECGEAVRITADSFKSDPRFKMYQAKSSPYEVYLESSAGAGIRYFCLPDTVDPRGPKGK